MTLAAVLDNIRNTLQGDGYYSEAEVCQGAIVQVLRQLGWPEYDTNILIPEYGIGPSCNTQLVVDYALCLTSRKPSVFVEVKKPGEIDDIAEKKLFDYVHAEYVPLALLTDGCEWHFFLPQQQDGSEKRLFCILDLLKCDVSSSKNQLRRYLEYEAVRSGKALAAAKEDYKARPVAAKYYFKLDGTHYEARSVDHLLQQALSTLIKRVGEDFAERFVKLSPKNRPFIASSPEEIYPDRKDLRHYVVPLLPTTYCTSTAPNTAHKSSRLEKAKRAASACGMEFLFSLPSKKSVKNS